MRKARNQSGVASLELGLLLVLVAIIGFTGYKVYQSRQNVNSVTETTLQTSSSQKSLSSDTSQVPPVNSTSDLDKAQSALDKENPDDNSTDVSQLNSQTNY
jgi:cytoskeletal protein RodZ